MLYERLKAETRHNHVLLEKIIVKQIRSIRKPQDYVTILKQYYAFIHPVEEKISQVPESPGYIHSYGFEKKSAALMNDILSIDEKYKIENQYFKPVYIQDHFDSLGALYVLEGSMLGGQVISRMIREALGTAEGAFSYFTFYGDDTAEKWALFKNHLAGTGFTEEQNNRVIEAANQTFSYFRQHFSETYAA